jgi:hypothetical protein
MIFGFKIPVIQKLQIYSKKFGISCCFDEPFPGKKKNKPEKKGGGVLFNFYYVPSLYAIVVNVKY